MAEKKSNIMEIIQGISQAAANAYDGASDENGEPLKVGLMREEGHPILDTRVMDGFGVCFIGNKLRIKYQGEVTLKEVYKGDFEGDIVSRLGDIASFLKKEYKKITGNGLTLTKLKDSEPQVLVQSTSRVRSWVQAQQDYIIGGIPEEPHLGHTVEERLTDSIKKWIGYGKDKFPNTKKPENVSGKRDLEPPEKKKKIAEDIDKKKLRRAMKIINEKMTIDGKKIGPKAEAWLKKKLSANPKVAKAFGLKGGTSGKKEAPAKVEDSAVEKAIDKVADDPKALEKALKNPKADAALDAQIEKEKEVVKSAFDQAVEGQDALAKEIAKSDKVALEKLIQSNELSDKFRATPTMETLQAFQKVWAEKNKAEEESDVLRAQWQQEHKKIKSDVMSGKLEEFLSLINKKEVGS